MTFRVLVMTGHRRGIASRCLPALCKAQELEVSAVVFVTGPSRDRRREWQRRLRKIRRIGPLGAINGLRLREWYTDPESEDIESVAGAYGVPFQVTPSTNDTRTAKIFLEANADVGLSLGNGYIPESIFSIPRFGMLNCHGELLPEYKGAQSVIWPIHDGRKETGFTIHRLSKTIDGGAIVYREAQPIVFRETLRETVVASVNVIRQRIPECMVQVCSNLPKLLERATEQRVGRSLTTPTCRQYLKMLRNHRRLYSDASSDMESSGACGKI